MITSTLRFRLPALVIFSGFVFAFSISFAASPSPSPTPVGAIDEKLFKGMQWRQIGPFRGGRALTIEGVPGEQIGRASCRERGRRSVVAGSAQRGVGGRQTWRA